ncbi:MAG TPA: adenosylcobinamide-GDP ribazoletransferase [Candidatus Binatia bacterium]|nr:adenosylcobinamide-GDP ribazoletransferase [Candidatus Binatia bacterium]
MTEAETRDASDDQEPAEWWRAGRRPRWKDCLAAIEQLTPLARVPTARIGRSALFYPLVGLLLGAVWVGTDYAAGTALGVSRLRTAIAIAAWLVISGGRRLRGFAQASAALSAGRDRVRAITLMGGRSVGFVGALGTLLMLTLQAWSLAKLVHLRALALLFAPLLSCWSMVVLVHGSRAARTDGRQVKYASEVGFHEFALTSVFTFGLVFSLAEATGIFIGACVGAAIVLVRVGYHRWLSGVTDAVVAAGAEATFTLVLVLAAVLEGGL